MNQGWECPRCGRCYAPHVKSCEVCGPQSVFNAFPSYPFPYFLAPNTRPLPMPPTTGDPPLEHRPIVTCKGGDAAA